MIRREIPNSHFVGSGQRFRSHVGHKCRNRLWGAVLQSINVLIAYKPCEFRFDLAEIGLEFVKVWKLHFYTSLLPKSYHAGEGKSKGGITTKNLALMRERAKLTQRELADVLGVERSTVAKWESGAAYPRASQLPALAKALGCSIDELYSREEERA